MKDKEITLSDHIRYGKNESMEAFNNCFIEVMQAINKAKLTELTTCALLQTLGSIGDEMVSTPEKELEVCFGTKTDG